MKNSGLFSSLFTTMWPPLGCHWGHMGHIGCQMVTTWGPHGHTRCPHRAHWAPDGDHMGATWGHMWPTGWPHGAPWGPQGHHLGAFVGTLGHHWGAMGTPWEPQGSPMAAQWPPSLRHYINNFLLKLCYKVVHCSVLGHDFQYTGLRFEV